jgi:hypothetical protein
MAIAATMPAIFAKKKPVVLIKPKYSTIINIERRLNATLKTSNSL